MLGAVPAAVAPAATCRAPSRTSASTPADTNSAGRFRPDCAPRLRTLAAMLIDPSSPPDARPTCICDDPLPRCERLLTGWGRRALVFAGGLVFDPVNRVFRLLAPTGIIGELLGLPDRAPPLRTAGEAHNLAKQRSCHNYLRVTWACRRLPAVSRSRMAHPAARAPADCAQRPVSSDSVGEAFGRGGLAGYLE